MNTPVTNGRLVRILPSGRIETLINNLPFALLQSKRQELINGGQYKAEELRIKYME